MTRRPTNLFAFAILIITTFPAFGAGDPAAGQAKAALCTACHGADGNSLTTDWPNLAGQHAKYLERQIRLYKDGSRANITMQGMVGTLQEQDIQDVSAYYATQAVKAGVADDALAEVGRALYHGGDLEREIPACMGCHGPSGSGNPGPSYPALAGQKAGYTALTLRAFRDGAVWGAGDDGNEVMAEVASKLTDAEIEALASYLEGLYAASPVGGTAE